MQLPRPEPQRRIRRALVVSLAVSALPGRAQQSGKMPRVVWISNGGSPTDEANFERRMQTRFRELGWEYGRNLQYEIRRFRGDTALLQRHAVEIAAMKPDVVLVGDNYTVAPLLQAGVKSPIVLQVGSNLQEIGLVKSYARPGGHITGLAWDQSAGIVEKHPQFLKELVPDMTRLGEVLDSSIPGVKTFQEVSDKAAAKLGLTMLSVEVRRAEDLEPAVAKLASQGAQAINIWGSPLTYLNMQHLINLTQRYKLPDMTIFRLATELGGLASYGASIIDLYVQSISYADKILRGASPGELPIELPRTYELVINEKRARALGLTIPKSMLALADEVIR